MVAMGGAGDGLHPVCLWLPLAHGTLSHGRPLRIPVAVVFGVTWGLAQGQLALSVYTWIEGLGLSRQWNVAIMFVAYSAFTAAWHSRFWDIHIAPDHNVREWNLRKVLMAHTPFLLLCILHLAIFGNQLLFVAWHVLALTACAWAMHFPAPWDPDRPGHDSRGVSMRDTTTG